jgi:flagellar protein FlaG
MMQDNLITSLPLQPPAGTVKAPEIRGGGGRVEPSGQVPGGKALPQSDLPAESESVLPSVVASLNDYAQVVQRDLQFTMDEASGRAVITVRDRETEEIIRQIPPESALALVSDLRSQGTIASFGLVEKA